jgi:hypothetical protein
MSDATVIVLTYAQSATDRLRSLLLAQPGLACTSGTGILPLCEQASASWRRADGVSVGPLPSLAVASIRAMATPLLTVLLARAGKRRWCEFAAATPNSAETFLELFPRTSFLALHRACPDVIYAALHDDPWGPTGPAFAPFMSAHPASMAAALMAYWIAHAGPLIAFEQAHPGACHRVRYEDLQDGLPSDLCTFLGLADLDSGQPAWRVNDQTGPASDAGTAAVFPAGQVPPALLAEANDLMKDLGYPVIG